MFIQEAVAATAEVVNSGGTDLIATQLTSSAMVVWVIQELKKAGWCSWLTMDSVKANRIVSALAALASGAAINYNWDAATATLTITGLTATAIAAFGWNAVQQFIGQEIIYQAVFAPKVALETAREDLKQQIGTGTGHVVKTEIKAAEKIVEAIKDTNTQNA